MDSIVAGEGVCKREIAHCETGSQRPGRCQPLSFITAHSHRTNQDLTRVISFLLRVAPPMTQFPLTKPLLLMIQPPSKIDTLRTNLSQTNPRRTHSHHIQTIARTILDPFETKTLGLCFIEQFTPIFCTGMC